MVVPVEEGEMDSASSCSNTATVAAVGARVTKEARRAVATAKRHSTSSTSMTSAAPVKGHSSSSTSMTLAAPVRGHTQVLLSR